MMPGHRTVEYMKRINLATTWLRLGLAVLMMLPALLVVPMVRADGEVTLSGRVYNGTTGAGYKNIEVTICGFGAVRTGQSGNWSLVVPKSAAYCVRLGANAPVGTVVTRNNPGFSGASYENQWAGESRGGQDRVIDDGLDFVYGLVAAKPTPKPVTVTPAPAPAPVGALGAPTDFIAKQGADSAKVVGLSWHAGGDPQAITAYRVERSLDRTTWQEIARLNGTEFQDESVSAGVHYYYRVAALGLADQVSEMALADVETGSVLVEEVRADVIYISEDHLITVTVGPDVMPKGADCKIANSNPETPVGRVHIAGAYFLECRTTTGDMIPEVSGVATWRFDIQDQLKGYVDPVMVSYGGDHSGELVSGVAYDAKAGTLTVQAPAMGRYAVLAAEPSRAWIGWAVMGGFMLLIIAALAFIPLRTNRRQNYQEYLRSKYYNL